MGGMDHVFSPHGMMPDLLIFIKGRGGLFQILKNRLGTNKLWNALFLTSL